jgi:pyridoxamine 5'-phosphate oxidase
LKAVFASRNRHKVEQVQRLLPRVELMALDDIAPDLVLDEPYDTFEENALAKARTAASATGLPAIADDSGIEVDALNGAPGVRSARYAGDDATDEANNAKLVAALRDVPEPERTCRYRCVATAVWPDGRTLIAHGSCEGSVVLEGRGDLGFGYDPHVVPEGETRTMGEIPLDEKLRFSHRGRAFRLLAEKLDAAAASDLASRLRLARGIDTLEENAEPIDPLVLFGRWLREAIEQETGEPNAMTLATASREGRVTARTVLLRGFDDRGLVFFTNYTSRKGRDLEENPRAAAVFYWGTLQRQVTVTGDVVRTPPEESLAYFRSRPRSHQLGAWASPQSSPIGSRAEIEEKVVRLEAEYAGKEIPLPPFWGGFRLIPDAIEFWQGRPSRLHDRIRFTREAGAWRTERLAP